MEDDSNSGGRTPPGAAKVVNAATHITISKQVIYVDGAPRLVRELPDSDLALAQKRLERVANRYATKSFWPLALPILVFGLIVVGLDAAVSADEGGTSQQHRYVIGYFGLMFSVPLWFATYDVRRRHRAVVQLAERQLAEIKLEIGLRHSEDETSPAKKLASWAMRGFSGRSA